MFGRHKPKGEVFVPDTPELPPITLDELAKLRGYEEHRVELPGIEFDRELARKGQLGAELLIRLAEERNRLDNH